MTGAKTQGFRINHLAGTEQVSQLPQASLINDILSKPRLTMQHLVADSMGLASFSEFDAADSKLLCCV